MANLCPMGKIFFAHGQVLSCSDDFKAVRELRNPLSKRVPGKFHGSDGHSKWNCLQDRANFHRSRAMPIVLIFNTAVWYVICCKAYTFYKSCMYTLGQKFSDLFFVCNFLLFIFIGMVKSVYITNVEVHFRCSVIEKDCSTLQRWTVLKHKRTPLESQPTKINLYHICLALDLKKF